MPTYDYHCEACGRDFEAYRSFTDESVPKCPGRDEGSCSSKGKGKVTKVLSVPAISFRGDGFYKNDSRSSSGTTTPKSSSTTESSSSDGGSSSGSSESSSSKEKKSTETKPSDSKPKKTSSDAA